MRIKISKNQWELAGVKAGWIKRSKMGKKVNITNPA